MATHQRIRQTTTQSKNEVVEDDMIGLHTFAQIQMSELCSRSRETLPTVIRLLKALAERCFHEFGTNLPIASMSIALIVHVPLLNASCRCVSIRTATSSCSAHVAKHIDARPATATVRGLTRIPLLVLLQKSRAASRFPGSPLYKMAATAGQMSST